MKEIKLTKGQYALVDDSDYEFLNQWKWYSSHGYATRDSFIPTPHGKYKKQVVSMHRLLMGVIGEPKLVDHIDRNPLNNQRSNLRLCTKSQNNANKGIESKNTSGYKGVSWCSTAKMWRVRCGKKTIGRFHDIKKAAKVYNETATAMFGEFAYQNKIGEK